MFFSWGSSVFSSTPQTSQIFLPGALLIVIRLIRPFQNMERLVQNIIAPAFQGLEMHGKSFFRRLRPDRKGPLAFIAVITGTVCDAFSLRIEHANQFGLPHP